MNKIIPLLSLLALMALPCKSEAFLSRPGYFAVADTAFVNDTARVVSTRLSADTLVVDTTLMVSTTYVVAPSAKVLAPTEMPAVTDSLSVRLVSGLGLPDTCLVEWTDSLALTLQFPLTVSKKEVKKDYCLWFSPALCGAADTMDLPAVVFQGKRHRKYNVRKAWLDGRQEWYPAVPKGTPGDTLWYEMRIEVKPWMRYGHLTLCLNREKEGCCTVDTLDPVCQEPFRYRPPYCPELPLVQPLVYPLAQENPVLHHLSDYRPYDGTQVLRKEPGALYVYYPVNRYFLDTLYRSNNETLDKIVELTLRVAADTAADVRFIEVIGLASPEGPLDFNIRLAQRRAEALARYIQERTGYPDSLFRLISGGPAWTELRDIVADTDSSWSHRADLLQLIDSISDPVERERSLRRFAGGRAYRELGREALPELRNAGYVRIYYDNAPDRVAIVINRAIGLLNSGYSAEALAMLETVAHDSRSYNALGNACYVNGDPARAIDYLQRAADAGDEAAARNLFLIRRIVGDPAM